MTKRKPDDTFKRTVKEPPVDPKPSKKPVKRDWQKHFRGQFKT